METITDHLFWADTDDTCVVCDLPESNHDDDNYDPTPQDFAPGPARGSIEFQPARFDLGE